MKNKVSTRFGNPFGPVGSSAGFFLLIGGALITVFFSLSGLILILPGAFMAFTHSSSTINAESKRIKFSNNLFGILSFGKWVDISNDMLLRLKKYSGSYTAYSRSNRRLDNYSEEYRIYLCDEKGREILPIMRSNAISPLKSEAQHLASNLELIVE